MRISSWAPRPMAGRMCGEERTGAGLHTRLPRTAAALQAPSLNRPGRRESHWKRGDGVVVGEQRLLLAPLTASMPPEARGTRPFVWPSARSSGICARFLAGLSMLSCPFPRARLATLPHPFHVRRLNILVEHCQTSLPDARRYLCAAVPHPFLPSLSFLHSPVGWSPWPSPLPSFRSPLCSTPKPFSRLGVAWETTSDQEEGASRPLLLLYLSSTPPRHPSM